MYKIFFILQIIVSALLVVFILLQQRGTALGGAFGQEGGAYFKKRGAEKMIFRTSVILAILFVLLSLLNIIIT